jgi:molecular chaperone DnaK
MDRLTKASHKMAEAMYKSAAGPEATAGAAGSEPPKQEGAEEKKKDEKVVDAEFTETKE